MCGDHWWQSAYQVTQISLWQAMIQSQCHIELMANDLINILFLLIKERFKCLRHKTVDSLQL